MLGLEFACGAAGIVSPRDGQVVKLLSDVQRVVLSLPTQKERSVFLKRYRETVKPTRQAADWHRAKPLTLRWKPEAGEKAPWEIALASRPDFSDAQFFYGSPYALPVQTNAEGVAEVSVPSTNLELGRTYYWRVACNYMCGKWGHVRGKCGCTNVVEKRSATVTFVTDELAPRWIATEGRVGNVRDLGGRRTTDGRRVRQGMIYRGQGLNESSATGERPGRNKMTVEDVQLFTKTLGIRTDLDLRMQLETGGLTESPLGAGIRYVQRESECYRGIFNRHGMKVMAENFREFCNPANYPVYFHCRDGADRTGALAYVLNGVLGVSRQELETDWESTFYPAMPDDHPDQGHWRRLSHLDHGFSKYGKAGDSWNRRIELYLLDCGVTETELRKFREIMLDASRPQSRLDWQGDNITANCIRRRKSGEPVVCRSGIRDNMVLSYLGFCDKSLKSY